MKFKSLDEVRKSEVYQFYTGLSYTDAQAVTLSLLDLSEGPGEKKWILDAYDTRSKEDTRSFPQFFTDYVFDKKRFVKDGFTIPKDEEPYRGGPVPLLSGIFSGVAEAVSNTAAKMTKNRKVFARPVVEEMVEPPEMCESAPVEEGYAEPVEVGSEIEIGGANIEDIRTDTYETIEEKGMRKTIYSPTATFRPTYNTAAASILLGNIRNHANTRHSMVRTEELLNYLSYDLSQPVDGRMFAVTKELLKKDNKTFLFLGVQGKRTLPGRQNICFLLDVSGSMYSRSDNMVMSIMAVLSRMKDGDVFSLVTYSSKDHVVINGLTLNKEKDVDEIIHIIMKTVSIYGCTNGSGGIDKAYEIIESNMIKDGVNRVIILTDGDLNFGISDKDGLTGLINKKKKTGAYFSAIGTGIFNLQDDKLEALAKNGNGNYFVVNEKSDIEKNIVDRYESLVYPIAKNVKAQVEFNPARISAYKLIGYENRMLNHEDFRDDTVIAEPFGSGSYCVALFEVEMAGETPEAGGLKYQSTVLTDKEELCTITIRFEDIESDEIKEESFPVSGDLPAGENSEKAAQCAAIASKLREENADELTREKLLALFR